MIDKKKLLMGSAIVALSAFAVEEADAAAGKVSMTAEILTPITVAQKTALNFGDITETGAGTVKVARGTGTRTATLAANLAGGTVSDGVLTITAATAAALTLTVDTAAPTVSQTAGTKTMSITGINFSVTGANWLAGANKTITADNQGTNIAFAATKTTGDVQFGGILNVANGQAVGVYKGSFNVTVVYQ